MEGIPLQQISTVINQFIDATAWQWTTPKAYGPFHLIFTMAGFALCFILAMQLRNLSDRGSRILLMSVGIFLVITELYKQLLYYYHIHEGQYSWWIFPFQLCSVPMYLCIIAPLLKPGRTQKAMYSFMMLYNLLGGAVAFAEPSGLLHSYITLTVHSMLWHMLLVFVGLFLVFSGRGGITKRDYWDSTKTFLCLCAVAFCINLIFRDVSGGSINMFFVGPSNSSLIVFKQISEMFGWYVSTALYIPVVCLGAYLLFLLIRILKVRSAKHSIA